MSNQNKVNLCTPSSITSNTYKTKKSGIGNNQNETTPLLFSSVVLLSLTVLVSSSPSFPFLLINLVIFCLSVFLPHYQS